MSTAAAIIVTIKTISENIHTPEGPIKLNLFRLQMMNSPSVMVAAVWFPCCRNMGLFPGLSRLPPPHLLLNFSASLLLFFSPPDYLTDITTTSREMMVIGHFGLGQLRTWKQKWLQLGVLGSNLFNHNTFFFCHVLCTLRSIQYFMNMRLAKWVNTYGTLKPKWVLSLLIFHVDDTVWERISEPKKKKNDFFAFLWHIPQ